MSGSVASREEEQASDLDPFLYGSDSSPKDIMQELNKRGVDPGSLDSKGDELINGADASGTIEELLQDPLNTTANQPLRHDRSLDPLSMFDESGSGNTFGDILQAGKQGAGSKMPSHMDLTHGSELGGLFHLPDTGGKPSPGSTAAPPAPVQEPKRPDADTHPAENAGNVTDFGDIDAFIAGLGSDPAPVPETGQPAVDPLSALFPDTPPANPVSQPSVSSALPTPPSASTISEIPGMPVDEPSAATDADELYQAFIEGLGMELPGRKALDKAYMKMLGQVLRNYTQGTVELISGRTVVKQAVRANVTVIAPERNNPLKFSPDGNIAVQGMFGRSLPGFMEPVEAVYSAFVDLRAHQIGVISGMQAALNDVLDRFNPAILGDKIPPRGWIENTLPMAHKARLWGEYGRYFRALREKASDHFQEFFGEAFLKAYETAILTVKSGERTGRS